MNAVHAINQIGNLQPNRFTPSRYFTLKTVSIAMMPMVGYLPFLNMIYRSRHPVPAVILQILTTLIFSNLIIKTLQLTVKYVMYLLNGTMLILIIIPPSFHWLAPIKLQTVRAVIVKVIPISKQPVKIVTWTIMI